MRLLLDTQILLWALGDDPRLGAAATAVRDGSNTLHVSAVSIWEISINRALGQLQTPDTLLEVAGALGVAWLDVTPEHGWRAGRLPAHHHDPFDRMLLAQAAERGLTLVTADRRMSAYGVDLLTP